MKILLPFFICCVVLVSTSMAQESVVAPTAKPSSPKYAKYIIPAKVTEKTKVALDLILQQMAAGASVGYTCGIAKQFGSPEAYAGVLDDALMFITTINKFALSIDYSAIPELATLCTTMKGKNDQMTELQKAGKTMKDAEIQQLIMQIQQENVKLIQVLQDVGIDFSSLSTSVSAHVSSSLAIIAANQQDNFSGKSAPQNDDQISSFAQVILEDLRKNFSVEEK